MTYELFSSYNRQIYLVDMKTQRGYFSELVEQSVRKQLELGRKILLLTNKVGFASGVICHSCGHIPQCTNCSVSIAYHQSPNGVLYGICPICKTLYDYPKVCENCGKNTLQTYGLTTQMTADWVHNEFKTTPLLIQAKHGASFSKAKKLLASIDEHQMVIATDTIIPAEVSSKFDLVVVLAADQGLTLPDYSVQAQVFYRLQRIFTHFQSKFMIVQSYDTAHPSIRLACADREEEFKQIHNIFLADHSYPTFGELCIIKYNSDNETTLHNAITKLQQEISYLQHLYHYQQIELFSSSPLIYKKFGKFYYHIILKGKSVRPFMDIAFSKLKMAKRGYKIDRMAESLL